MPGTEYQFRLRAFSNGVWQSCQESIVSSPFKTICSPPDPPPSCPRTLQLESSCPTTATAAGGVVTDTGALLAVAASTATSGDGSGGGRGENSGNKGVSCYGRGGGSANQNREAVGSSCTAVTMAAAVARGEARAQAEWHDERFRGGSGDGGGGGSGATKDLQQRDIAEGRKDGDRPTLGRGATKDGHGKGIAGGGNWDPSMFGQGRREERGGGGEKGEQERGGGAKQEECVRRGDCGEGKGVEEEPLRVPEAKGVGVGQEGEELEGTERGSPDGGASAGSTLLVLEWDGGCANGAITTNYEVGKNIWRRDESGIFKNQVVTAPLRGARGESENFAYTCSFR